VRTDLDAFSDLEAYALMTSAYRMTDFQLARMPLALCERADPATGWGFLAVEPWMAAARPTAETESLLRVVGVGSQRFFKTWALSAPVRQAAFGGSAATLVAGAVLVGRPLLTATSGTPTPVAAAPPLGGTAALVGAAVLVVALLLSFPRLRALLLRALRVALAVPWALGVAAFSLLDRLLDPIYLRRGRVARAPAPGGAPTGPSSPPASGA
jgi:NTE family protein